ncbi:hypothetical protein Dsin_006262 [Dipteronia sinensis]|uniref:Zinc knuckle CX2CX4HX4C domain-containing protein n=1 Tax=Dipteronia sinensis TaxID=43782 RepID=A0AAE0AYV0_9ROSI|nr:hypothetical protein Dsin_006262 [Dipteronia sinensis]
MCLKVAIDVSKPLKRFLRLELEKGEESILLLRYENLQEYCFQCGIIGHSYQECHKRKEKDGEANMDFEFGPRMRAMSLPGQNRSAGQYRYRGEVSNARNRGLKKSSFVNVNPNRTDEP